MARIYLNKDNCKITKTDLYIVKLEMSDGTNRIFDDLSEMIIGKFYSSSPCTARVTVAYRGYETFTELEILEPDNITIRKVGENVRRVAPGLRLDRSLYSVGVYYFPAFEKFFFIHFKIFSTQNYNYYIIIS